MGWSNLTREIDTEKKPFRMWFSGWRALVTSAISILVAFFVVLAWQGFLDAGQPTRHFFSSWVFQYQTLFVGLLTLTGGAAVVFAAYITLMAERERVVAEELANDEQRTRKERAIANEIGERANRLHQIAHLVLSATGSYAEVVMSVSGRHNPGTLHELQAIDVAVARMWNSLSEVSGDAGRRFTDNLLQLESASANAKELLEKAREGMKQLPLTDGMARLLCKHIYLCAESICMSTGVIQARYSIDEVAVTHEDLLAENRKGRL